MDFKGKAKVLKIYVNEDSTYKGHVLYHALVTKLKELGLAGVTVTRGIEGYGHGKRLRTARILDLSSSLPIIIEAIDLPEHIENAIPVVTEMVEEGLIITTEVDAIQCWKG